MRVVTTVFIAVALVAGRVEASRGLSESPKPKPEPSPIAKPARSSSPWARRT